MQPLYIYFYHFPDTFPAGHHLPPHNLDMGFIRSHQVVLSYENAINPSLRIKAETYYQYLFDVPVEIHPSSFSMLNQGSVFERFFPDTLKNTGTGRNYGVELTVEKFFSKSYFVLFTASLYDSKYRGSDGVLRNTNFNGNYVLNALAAREIPLGKKSALTLGGKLTYAGGARYSPPDLKASMEAAETVAIDSLRNTLQFPAYFRADLKIGVKINRKHFTHEIAIDLVNITNHTNYLSKTFNTNYKPGMPADQAFYSETQLGFLPLFYYKLDFTSK
jgi:outer membrane receptor protein involved in Fe transport